MKGHRRRRPSFRLPVWPSGMNLTFESRLPPAIVSNVKFENSTRNINLASGSFDSGIWISTCGKREPNAGSEPLAAVCPSGRTLLQIKVKVIIMFWIARPKHRTEITAAAGTDGLQQPPLPKCKQPFRRDVDFATIVESEATDINGIASSMLRPIGVTLAVIHAPARIAAHRLNTVEARQIANPHRRRDLILHPLRCLLYTSPSPRD